MSEDTHAMRIARPADLSFVLHLQRVWSNAVGFLPKPALERYIDNRATLLVQHNNQHAGYLSWTLTKKGLLHLHQLAIEPELLRGRCGTDIMQYIERAARKGHCSVIRFQSRIDLAANIFFNGAGFKTTAVFMHPTARRKPIIEWSKCLLDPSLLTDALIARNIRFKRRAPIPKPQLVHPRSTIID